MTRYTHLALLLLLLMATACKQGRQNATLTEAQRRAMDSIVASSRSIDSTRAMVTDFEKTGNTLGEIMALRHLSKLYREESRFTEAIDCHQQALRLATDIGDTLEMIQALNGIGTNYRRLGSLEEAAQFHQQAANMSNDMSDKNGITAKKNYVVSLNGMGNVLLTLGNLVMADSVFRLALQGEHALGSALGQAINLANLGAIKEELGQTDSAWYYYQQSLKMNEQAHSDLGVALCHIHFGELSEKDGHLDKALEEYDTAYGVLKATGDEWHWLESALCIARVYIKKGNTGQALAYLQDADETARRIGSQEHLVEVYRTYYMLHQANGNSKEALNNYVKATELKDSLMNTQTLTNIQNQRLSYERVRRQHELEMAQEQLALEHSEKTTILVAAIALLLLIVGLAALMWYHMHTREQKQQMAQQLQKTREMFFTNITHEFRTPLTVILGLGHQLEDMEQEDMAQVRSAAKMMVRQGNSLLGLINQLLDVSKVRSAVGEAKWSHGDIVAFVGMAVENFRPYADSKRQELTFTHSQTTLTMDFVPDYIEKIMSNLLTNAIKYTPSYGKVNVTLEQSGNGKLKIQVFDTGRGISADDLPRIFDAFVQGNTQPGDVGTGVGLSLVRLMTEAMDGTVSAVSTEGQGSTFTVVLPIKSRKIQTNQTSQTSPTSPTPNPSRGGEGRIYSQGGDYPQGNYGYGNTNYGYGNTNYGYGNTDYGYGNTGITSGEYDGTELYPPLPPAGGAGGGAVGASGASGASGPSVLIIEDNQDIAFYIGMHLKGCRIIYARGAEEGLQKAREVMPDIIITDIMMPGGMDGLQLCRSIRKNEMTSHIPIIIITAKTTEEDRIKGLEAGADAYLVKPFNSEELMVRVRKLMERQQLMRNKYALAEMDDDSMNPAELTQQDRTFMNRLVDVVYRQMGVGQVDMDSIAQQMAISRTQLNRKVLAITGENASAYVMKLRLARAKRLLKANIETPVGDVAMKCGFDDVAYFSRIFKQTFQMTPSQYRKQQI